MKIIEKCHLKLMSLCSEMKLMSKQDWITTLTSKSTDHVPGPTIVGTYTCTRNTLTKGAKEKLLR